MKKMLLFILFFAILGTVSELSPARIRAANVVKEDLFVDSDHSFIEVGENFMVTVGSDNPKDKKVRFPIDDAWEYKGVSSGEGTVIVDEVNQQLIIVWEEDVQASITVVLAGKSTGKFPIVVYSTREETTVESLTKEIEISDSLPEEQEKNEEKEIDQDVRQHESSDSDLKNSASKQNVVTGLWGSIPWEWDSDAAIIKLHGGTAGFMMDRPWNTNATMKNSLQEIIITDTIDFIPGGADGSTVHTEQMFADLPLVEVIEGLGLLNVSNVVTMWEMFARTPQLKEADLSNWNNSSNRGINSMFSFSGVERVNVKGFDTSNVVNMSAMFDNAKSLRELDVSEWDTSNVTNMRKVFESTDSLIEVDVANWNTAKVTDMSRMFFGKQLSTEFEVSNWNTANVSTIAEMFDNASSLTELDLSRWDTSNVTNMNNFLNGTFELSTLHLGAKSIFNSTVNLPAISITDRYVGSWRHDRKAADMTDNPPLWTSSEFMDQYNGNEPGAYTWARSANLEVHHISESGDTLAPMEKITGVLHNRYETSEQQIKGWSLLESPDNASGIYTDETQTVRYIYEQESAILIVEFINELDQLLPGYTITIIGNIGDEIDLTKEDYIINQLADLEDAGYKIIERPSNENAVKFDSNEVVVQYKIQGILSLASVPDALDFGSLTYDAKTQRIEAPTIDQPLIVTDTRAEAGDGWKLTAALSTPMTNTDGKELVNALRYVHQGQEIILDPNSQPVYLNMSSSNGHFDVSSNWGTETGTDGIKLQIESDDIIYVGDYVGVITWKLISGRP